MTKRALPHVFGKEKPRVVLAHKLVVKVAREICMDTFEQLMTASNTAWKEFRSQCEALGLPSDRRSLEREWLRRFLPSHVPMARATLAAALSGPLDEKVKSAIVEALILDQRLEASRSRPQFMF